MACTVAGEASRLVPEEEWSSGGVRVHAAPAQRQVVAPTHEAYSWRNCLSRRRRVAFPCLNAPPALSARSSCLTRGVCSRGSVAQSSTARCGRCSNCRIFSWSHLEATLWLAGHVFAIGAFYYCCLIPYFEENQQYVYGQVLVHPGSSADLFTARCAEYFFSALRPLRFLLRVLYAVLLVPFEFLSSVLPFRFFIYTPVESPGLPPVYGSGVRDAARGRSSYLLDQSDGQYRELRNAFPLLFLLMCVHGILAFFLRKFAFRFFCRRYSTAARGGAPHAFFKLLRRAPQTASHVSSPTWCVERPCGTPGYRGASAGDSRAAAESSPLSGGTDLGRLLHPPRSSAARRAWIATQRVQCGFELLLGLGLAAYLHSIHLLVLLFHALLNYSFTMLLSTPDSAASPPSPVMTSNGHSVAPPLQPASRSPAFASSVSFLQAGRHLLTTHRCTVVVTLSVGLHFAMLVLHGLTPQFSLAFIHPSLLPVEMFFFAFVRPRYSLHDCVRMIALKLLSFNLDKVWAYQLHQRTLQSRSETGNIRGGAEAAKARWAPETGEQEKDSSDGGARHPLGSHAPAGIGEHSARQACRPAVPELCPSPFDDERFFPSDSPDIPYSTYGSIARYLAYVFFAPTYLAGPHFTYNSWNRQAAFPWWVLLGHNAYLSPSAEAAEKETDLAPCASTPNAEFAASWEGKHSEPRSEQDVGCAHAKGMKVLPRGVSLLTACASRALGVSLSPASCLSSAYPAASSLVEQHHAEADLELRPPSLVHREKGSSGVASEPPSAGLRLVQDERAAEGGTRRPASARAGAANGCSIAKTSSPQDKDENDFCPFGLGASPYLLDMPTSVYGKLLGRYVLPYFLRWILVVLLLELHLRYLPVNALVTQLRNIYLWRKMQIWQLFTMSVSVLCFMWLKFLCLWRFFRLWSMAAGAVPPENMVRCLYNNYSTEQFWRSWHRSFNLYLIRYMYVPVNRQIQSLLAYGHETQRKTPPSGSFGPRSGAEAATASPRHRVETAGWSKLGARFVSTFLVFSYVALWHEFSTNVFFWALGCAGCLVPEGALRYWAFLSPTAKAIGRGDRVAAAGGRCAERNAGKLQLDSDGPACAVRARHGGASSCETEDAVSVTVDDAENPRGGEDDGKRHQFSGVFLASGDKEGSRSDREERPLQADDRQGRRGAGWNQGTTRVASESGDELRAGGAEGEGNKRRQKSRREQRPSDDFLASGSGDQHREEYGRQRGRMKQANPRRHIAGLVSPRGRPVLGWVSRLYNGPDIRGKIVFKHLCILAGTMNVILLAVCNLVGYSYGAEGVELILRRLRDDGFFLSLRAHLEFLFNCFFAVQGMFVIRAIEGGRHNF
ncbi:hypothetical protein BESB_030370 [Besnoitia besnoiti]|uniref:Uncharacterized protein n=1 Tax=Besnoitia besnoiti TaxID=94643 RepID=A0A2A9M688_BESBE|nr:hypothetical protein BESB_030370 [Besnoitia besnoiti]PFH31163.1 hypothetical protein BESB_030370 [Besnoitia besnoiti]